MRFSKQGIKTTTLLVATAGFFACRTTTDSAVKSNDVVPFDGEHGMKPGVGYETIFEDVRGECVEYDETAPVSKAQEVIYDVKIVENTQELTTELNVTNAQEVKAAVPDTPASVSAKTKFALGHSYSLNRYSIFILAKVQVRNETTQLNNVRLKEEYKTMIASAAEDPDAVDRFRLACGDSFLAGYTTGGEFFGVLELATDSEEQKLELKKEVEAALAVEGVGEVSKQSSFELKITRATKSKKVKIWTYQRGGSGAEETGLADTPEAMIERVRNFPGFVTTDTNAANYTATFKDYFSLNVPLPLEYRRQLENAQDNLEELAGHQSVLVDRRGDIDYVLKQPNSFVGVTPAKLNDMRNAKKDVETKIKEIFKNARACYRDFRNCKINPTSTAGTFELPARKPTIAKITNDYLLIKTKVERVELDAIKDGLFNPAECYLEVRVVKPDGKDWKRIRRTMTEYKDPRCSNLSQELQIPLVVIKEAARAIGETEETAQIEVIAMEDDPGVEDDDVVGRMKKPYPQITKDAAVVDTMTGPNITMRVDFEIH